MSRTDTEASRRILIIDDNHAIHDDFRRLLAPPSEDRLLSLEQELFGVEGGPAPSQRSFDVDSAYQGRDGLQLVERALAEGRPYGLAFVDMRMPPGWDGVETIERIFAIDTSIQVVICTAYSEYSWEDIVQRFPASDRVLILRKPFDTSEVCQLASALMQKWHLAKRYHLKREQLESMVVEQTAELRTTQQRYLLAASGARDGLWDWDLVRGTTWFSGPWRAMLGLSEGAEDGSPELWLGRILPEDRPRLESALRDHVAGITPFIECEYRARHADGQPRWYLCRGLAVHDEHGRPVRAAGSQTDITDRKLAEDQLRIVGLRDMLTGLPNRAHLRSRLDCLQKSNPSASDIALLCLDIDRLKLVNDRFGHATGDALLVAFAARVVDVARSFPGLSDQGGEPLARVDGDEFVLLLEGLAASTVANQVAGAILASLVEPFLVDGRKFMVECTIGIATGGATADALFRDADVALYHAKAAGRNRYERFDPGVHDATRRRWQLEGELRAALSAGEFFVEYQPITDLGDGTVRSVEALVRWDHPRRGRIPPLEFIGIAEETGLIVPLGLEVLRIACNDLSRWRSRDSGLAGLRVAINVSPRQIEHGDVLSSFGAVIRAAGLKPKDIDIEITESVLMDALQARVVELDALRAAGHQLHLDDFGTGYCSMSYLRRVHVDALKIDRSFVQAMGADATTEAIIQAILSLAASFRIDVIAEGVETALQKDRLARLGCGLGQGWLFQRPMSADAMEAFLTGCPTRAAAS